MNNLSRPARVAVAVVLIATVAAEILAWFVYRNSSDGQTPVLWVFIALYGALLIGGVKILDASVRRVHRWLRRS